MNKNTIELERVKNFLSGYGRMSGNRTENDSETLDAIINWSRKNTKAKIYKHKVRRAEENISKNKFHYVSEYGFSQEKCKQLLDSGEAASGTNCLKTRYLVTKVPYCDLVYYLDIYWQ